MDVLEVVIKPCHRDDLLLVESNLNSKFHKVRFNAQENGEGLYLIAWHGSIPVGNVLIRWKGSNNNYIKENKVVMPYLEALLVKEEYRSKGIGRQIMEYAEKLIRENGFLEVGLAVGIENKVALKLYSSLGYHQYPGLEEFLVTRIFKNKAGLMVEQRETCVYLYKLLN